jgi:putative serine protease PepD
MTTPEPDGRQAPANPFAPPSPPRRSDPRDDSRDEPRDEPRAWDRPGGAPVTEPVPSSPPASGAPAYGAPASGAPTTHGAIHGASGYGAPAYGAPTTQGASGYGGPVYPQAGTRPLAPTPPAWSTATPSAVEDRGANPVEQRDPWTTTPAWPTAPLVPGLGPDSPEHRTTGRRGRRRRVLSVAWIVPLLLLALLAGAAGGVLADRTVGGGRLADAGLPVRAPSDDPARPAASIAGIAATVLPSVVSIEVTSAQGQASGSGFVLRQDGYLLTNNHVIAAGTQPGADIRVLFADGGEEVATIVGSTTDYDLAVLKVERTGLDPLLLADSSEVVVGDAVIAIGAPLGLEGTVTTGIVSALNRPVQAGAQGERAFINAIQTDAAINPGNSGGPLVNDAGEVIGINSAIAQPPNGLGAASGSIGLGFAIPSDQARRTAEELIETGTATYPIIGVLLDETYTGEGVQVAAEPNGENPAVTPDGPAENAGIRPGDVIVAIDGRPVTEPDELIVSIRAKAPGDTTVLRVRSGDEEREVRVVLDQATSD